MSNKININGQSYKVRERKVDNKKQEVLMKNGEAYIKNDAGELVKLHKNYDGSIFKKGSFITDETYNKRMDNFADKLNSRYESNERPELQVIDPSSFSRDADIVGMKGNFEDPMGRVFSGVVYRDKETQTNKIMHKSEGDGYKLEARYRMDETSGNLIREYQRLERPDGQVIEQIKDPETGESEIKRYNIHNQDTGINE